jgi:hypothetical protein
MGGESWPGLEPQPARWARKPTRWRVELHVFVQNLLPREFLVAVLALQEFHVRARLALVHVHVHAEVLPPRKRLAAHRARERLVATVRSQMPRQVRPVLVPLSAQLALVLPLVCIFRRCFTVRCDLSRINSQTCWHPACS